jgi:hypothetical protein
MSHVVQRRFNNHENGWRFRFQQNVDGFWGDVEGPCADEIELAARNVVVAVDEAAQAIMAMFLCCLIILSGVILFVLFASFVSQSYDRR